MWGFFFCQQKVTKGARHKIVISILKLKERQHLLRSLEKVSVLQHRRKQIYFGFIFLLKSFIPSFYHFQKFVLMLKIYEGNDQRRDEKKHSDIDNLKLINM